MTGIATTGTSGFMVRLATATPELEKPLLTAIARMVAVLERVKGPV
jgi:hypothetical protein